MKNKIDLLLDLIDEDTTLSISVTPLKSRYFKEGEKPENYSVCLKHFGRPYYFKGEYIDRCIDDAIIYIKGYLEKVIKNTSSDIKKFQTILETIKMLEEIE